MVENDMIERHRKFPVLIKNCHLFCLKYSIKKMFVFGLVFILYFLKLLVTIGF